MAPRVSSGTPLWRPIFRSSATTAWALANAASTSPKLLRTKATSVEWPASKAPGGASASISSGSDFCLDCHQIGGILRDIWIGGEDDGDRLADITHAIGGEDRLAIGIETFDAGEAKIDRRNVGDIRRGPDRNDTRNVACRGRIDRADAGMGVGGTHHAHVQLMRKRDVGGEAAIAGDERPIFKTRDRTADEVHRAKASR